VDRGRSGITMIIVSKNKYNEISKTADYSIKQGQAYSFRPIKPMLVDGHNEIVGFWRGEEVLVCPDENKVCDKCKHRFLCYTEKWL